MNHILQVQVDSTDISTRTGTDKNGKPYSMRSQTGYLDTGKRYPQELRFRLKDGQPAFPAGVYDVDVSRSSYINKYGTLALSEELVLVPAQKSAKAA